MFDDQSNQPSPIPPTQSSVPPVQAPMRGLDAAPEDIFAPVDSQTPAIPPAVQTAIRQLGRTAVNISNTPLRDVATSASSDQIKTRRSIGRVLFLVTIVVFGLAIVSVAGWYGYQIFSQSRGVSEATSSEQVPAATSNTTVTPVPETPVQPTGQVITPPTPPLDSDRDGLSDEEEGLYGTNPNSSDTDADGLGDQEEVKVFKTDPLKADSDGDGYTDGDEIRNGYDPKGSGRLLKIQ